MKIASFNINGIKARLPLLLDWLKESGPEIVALQEIKSIDANFPKSEIENLGYNVVTHGQKSFNGVAILSKYPIHDITIGLKGNPLDHQARWVEAEIEALKICCLYLPNGNPVPGPKFDYKLEWMERLWLRAKEIIDSEQATVILGDYNIIPQIEDAERPDLWVNDALFRIESRSLYNRILNLGFTDALRNVNLSSGLYTFWDYQGGAWENNNGIRIDHILLSPQVADLLVSCEIDSLIRSRERPSDHVPIIAEIKHYNPKLVS